MICPNCNKIIAEGSAECPFCKAQFTQAQAPVQGETVPGTAQMPYNPQVPYAPQMLTPEQKYQTLGGFLQFIVVLWKYIGPILEIFLIISYIIRGVKILTGLDGDNYSWETLKPAVLLFSTCVIIFIGMVIYYIAAIKLERRDSGFLRFWQIGFMIYMILYALQRFVFYDVLSGVLAIVTMLLLYAIWHIYFVTSLRVRIYMGSAAFLQKALYQKVLSVLKLNVSKQVKTKNALIAAALILVYTVLFGVGLYFAMKPTLAQYRAQYDSSQSGEQSTYAQAGVDFLPE